MHGISMGPCSHHIDNALLGNLHTTATVEEYLKCIFNPLRNPPQQISSGYPEIYQHCRSCIALRHHCRSCIALRHHCRPCIALRHQCRSCIALRHHCRRGSHPSTPMPMKQCQWRGLLQASCELDMQTRIAGAQRMGLTQSTTPTVMFPVVWPNTIPLPAWGCICTRPQEASHCRFVEIDSKM